ncbi:CapA family protein [Conexibacter sp. JD483]|uniref:CapA family protein n=1 Tax=unclassified Conexibacter TaxID=2627773 RepID=UPI002718F29B|nr:MULTISPECIES: CapA family protein [unclassified Conexibacter]MDO8185461.1 CapA family protein [Conexibacter sp. CPCC 205706]MDO8197352.1 CapA family protein [Conexibacter sp. CPCC 205762]MDR9372809.1 CapA family protein [Conexibacter sp. JD483]
MSHLRTACALLAVAAVLGGCAGSSDGGDATTPSTQAAADPLGNGRPVTIAFGGDVHFEEGLKARLAADPKTALDPLPRLLKGADLSVVNLETAVTADGSCPSRQEKQFSFATTPSAFTALRAAGVDAVSMANNHGLDCGRAGLEQTLAADKDAGLPLIGVGADRDAAFRPFTRTIDGQRIAIVAASQVLDDNLRGEWMATDSEGGMATARDLGGLVTAVRTARAKADTVVVFLHWGTELQQCPNTQQPQLLRLLQQAGADLVVGSHAHVLLGAGYSGRTYVAYGLGNLAFYAKGAPRTDSGVLQVTVTGRRVDKAVWRPATIQNGLPIPLEGGARRSAIDAWHALRDCTGLAAKPSGAYQQLAG